AGPAAAPPPAPAPAPAAPQAAMPAAPEGAPVARALPGSGGYPTDFPDDLPRYPGGKVTDARGSAQDGFALQIEAPDSVEVAAKNFGNGLTAAGWQTTVETSPDGTMVFADKQDGSKAQALVHDGEHGAS